MYYRKIISSRLTYFKETELTSDRQYAHARTKLHYYRAMHFSAKRGIAIACRLSVRLSVCLSVCNVGEL